jgi:hypothetical protein
MSLILIRTPCLTPLAAVAFSHCAPDPASLAPRSRAVVRPTYAGLFTPLPRPSRAPPAPRTLLQPCATLPAPSCSARRPQAEPWLVLLVLDGADARMPPRVLVLVVLVHRRLPPDPTPMTRINRPQPSSAICCKCMF